MQERGEHGSEHYGPSRDKLKNYFHKKSGLVCSHDRLEPPPTKQDRDFLLSLKEVHYPKTEVILLEQVIGPGICRNIGVLKAREHSYGYIKGMCRVV